jgi:hypothetical protein
MTERKRNLRPVREVTAPAVLSHGTDAGAKTTTVEVA